MSSDQPLKFDHVNGAAGVPSLDICEARAAAAFQAAQETKLSNVRDLYERSALRWSELANQKIVGGGAKR